MSEVVQEQEQQQQQQQQAQQGIQVQQPRNYQNKQNVNRFQFHKGGNNIQVGRPQPQKHYQSQRSYQSKNHNKNTRNQRNDYAGLQNIPPYIQYYSTPVANAFPNPGPGGFYSYSPAPYYPAPATMGYDGAIPPAIMNQKYKISQDTSESSAQSSATTTPVAKKIEITNKSGDHVDLNAIHLAQHATEATPLTTAGVTPANFSECFFVAGEGNKTDENTKKAQLDFLAEVKKRKEMLAKKKAVDEIDDTAQEVIIDTQKNVLEINNLSQCVPVDFVFHEADVRNSELDTVSVVADTSAVLTNDDDAQLNLEVSLSATTESKSTESIDLETPPVDSWDISETDVLSQNKMVAEEKPLTYIEKLRLKKAKLTDDVPLASVSASLSTLVVDSAVEIEADVTEEVSLLEITENTQEVAVVADNEQSEELANTTTLIGDADTSISGSGKETTSIKGFQQDSDDNADVNDGRLTMSDFLAKLETLPALEDIYSFNYPDSIKAPSDRFKKCSVKYTYPPEFLLQFGDKIKVRLDAKWKESIFTKIVIPPGTVKSRSKGGDRFLGSNFKRSASIRMGDRSNSKSMSKRSRSKRMGEDGKSNRGSYTSRKEREAKQEAEEKAKEEVPPLVSSVNRWIPKSKLKKTEKKLAPDGVTELYEKEQAERKMKSLLNKLTLEKFDPISEEIIGIANQSKWEDNGETLKIVIEQIFHKATDEPHWSSMYAQLCGTVVKDLDKDIKDKENEGKIGPILVLHYLFDRCQTEFQKGWADKVPTNEDGLTIEVELMSDEYYKAATAKRRGLGLVRLIGFLYRSNLLTSKMMFQCFRRLMKDLTCNPSEETLESVIELLNTVGEQFERDSLTTMNGSTLEGSALLDQLFVMLDQIIVSSEIPSRIKFSLLDLKDMRTASWNVGKKDEGPKTIAQIHEEEAAKKATEERERRMKSNSRSASKRQNNSMGGRSGSRREAPPVSKDDFITMRSASSRFSQQQKHQKEEIPTPQASSNMFSALMGHEDDDEDEDDEDDD